MSLAPPRTHVGLDPVSSLCTTGLNGNILTGIFVRLAREHFARPLDLEYNGSVEQKEELEGYIWSEDISQTRILIDAVWKFNSQDIQRRPAILVKRNAWKPQRLVIADGMTVGPARRDDGAIDRVRGQIQTKAVLGSHTLFCVGGTGAEAELLGAEVFRHLHEFSQVIREDVHLHRFSVEELGEVSLVEEFDDHFVVPVVAAYAFLSAWRVDIQAPWLKTIAIDPRPA